VDGHPHLSIGEVLSLLQEEFPDVTISKIRFLESQGLVDPERTPSGYRKFYEVDIDRLRWVLRQQRDAFLPLKVIKGRLEDQETEPVGPEGSGAWGMPDEDDEPGAGVAEPDWISREMGPEGAAGGGADDDAAGAPDARHQRGSGNGNAGTPGEQAGADHDKGAGGAARARRLPPERRGAPASRGSGGGATSPWPDAGQLFDLGPSAGGGGGTVAAAAPGRQPPPQEPGARRGGSEEAVEPGSPPEGVPGRRGLRAAPTVGPDKTGARRRHERSPEVAAVPNDDELALDELVGIAGVDVETVKDLERYGLITPRVISGAAYYTRDAAIIAQLASAFARHGVEARHLRAYKGAAEREAGIVQQVVMPLIRQRNPDARVAAAHAADELSHLGGELRAALLRSALADLR
jgi:DNA-binding transcriptional MerR regulator